MSPPPGVRDDPDDCRPADRVLRPVAAHSEAFIAKPNILLVDDEISLHSIVKGYFSEHGMVVTPAASRAEASVLLADVAFDLIVLDLRIGMDNGLDVLCDVRRKSNVPVIITTAHCCDEMDRVIGLELGADDYLVKPFGLRELLARARVIMRRAAARADPSTQTASRGLSLFSGWTLDRQRRKLTDRHGVKVELTKGEYGLLLAFLDAPQRPLTREYLLQATRVHEDIYDRSIDVQILRLRRKLEVDPSDPRIILTERGVGYVFAARIETRSKDAATPAAATLAYRR